MNNLKLKANWRLTEELVWNKMYMYVDVSHKGGPFGDQQYLLVDKDSRQAYMTTDYCWFVHFENSTMSDFLEFDCTKVDLNDFVEKINLKK